MPKPQVTDACVGTDDDLKDGSDKHVTKPSSEAAKLSPKPAPKELEQQEPLPGDILSSLLGFIFSSLVGLVWLVLVRIPFRIFTFSLLLVTTSAFLSIIWLYLADDHGAQMVGAGIPYGFNKAGIV